MVNTSFNQTFVYNQPSGIWPQGGLNTPFIDPFAGLSTGGFQTSDPFGFSTSSTFDPYSSFLDPTGGAGSNNMSFFSTPLPGEINLFSNASFMPTQSALPFGPPGFQQATQPVQPAQPDQSLQLIFALILLSSLKEQVGQGGDSNNNAPTTVVSPSSSGTPASTSSTSTTTDDAPEFDPTSIPKDGFYKADAGKILDKISSDSDVHWLDKPKTSDKGSLGDMLAKNDLEDLGPRDTDKDGKELTVDGDGTYLARFGAIGAEAGWKGDQCYVLTDDENKAFDATHDSKKRQDILDGAKDRELDRALGADETTLKLKAGENYHLVIVDPGDVSKSRSASAIYETDARDQKADDKHQNVKVFAFDDTKSRDNDKNDLVIRAQIGPEISDPNTLGTRTTAPDKKDFVDSALQTLSLGEFTSESAPDPLKDAISTFDSSSGSASDRKAFLNDLLHSDVTQSYLDSMPSEDDKINLLSLITLGRSVTTDELAQYKDDNSGDNAVSAIGDKMLSSAEAHYKYSHLLT